MGTPPLYPFNYLNTVLALNPVTVTSARYAATVGDQISADATSNNITIYLPVGAIAGQVVNVKLIAQSGSYSVTVARTDTDVININSTSVTLTLLNESQTFMSDGNGRWVGRCGNKTLSSLDGRYTSARTPADHGLLGWSYDVDMVAGSTALATAGTVYVTRVRVPNATFTATNVCLYVVTQGNTLTSGQCFAGLYNAAGTQLGVTADISSGASSFATANSYAFPLTAPVAGLTAGDYYVATFFNGTTGPALARTGTATAGLVNVGLSAPNFRHATADTGKTTALPATLGTQTASGVAYWAAIS